MQYFKLEHTKKAIINDDGSYTIPEGTMGSYMDMNGIYYDDAGSIISLDSLQSKGFFENRVIDANPIKLGWME